MKELKKYELKSCRRPPKWELLCTTVAVSKPRHVQPVGYCYVSFSAALIEAVGKKLQHGISKNWPAFLSVECVDSVKWNVSACYFPTPANPKPQSVLLWVHEDADAPDWLNFHPVKGSKT